MVLDFPFSNQLSALITKEEAGKRLARLNGHSVDDIVSWFRTYKCHFLFFFNSILIGALEPMVCY